MSLRDHLLPQEDGDGLVVDRALLPAAARVAQSRKYRGAPVLAAGRRKRPTTCIGQSARESPQTRGIEGVPGE